MLKPVLLAVAMLTMLAACTSAQSASNPQNSQTEVFGEAFSAKKALSYDQLVSKMTTRDSMPAVVRGKVNGVCQAKGCWMTIMSEKSGTPDMRVTFKNYGFFMPKDIAGKFVTVDGYAIIETTSVEMLRHFAEDAGKSQAEINAITQPTRELAFVASGVILEK